MVRKEKSRPTLHIERLLGGRCGNIPDLHNGAKNAENAMQTVSHSVAKSRDIAGNIAFIERTSRKPQTPAQKAVAPLTPIFEACHNRGLLINDANRVARLYAVNYGFGFGFGLNGAGINEVALKK